MSVCRLICLQQKNLKLVTFIFLMDWIETWYTWSTSSANFPGTISVHFFNPESYVPLDIMSVLQRFLIMFSDSASSSRECKKMKHFCFQDTLIALAKAVANATAQLVLKAKAVASTTEDQELQNRVISSATQCALATSQLVACTKVMYDVFGSFFLFIYCLLLDILLVEIWKFSFPSPNRLKGNFVKKSELKIRAYLATFYHRHEPNGTNFHRMKI